MSRSPAGQKEVALFFVEGDTEEEFYSILFKDYLPAIPKSVINLKGIYNIHRKVLGKTEAFLHRHNDKVIRVYCCIDRESREHNPPLDIEELRTSFKANKGFKRVLSADAIIATQMLESWFFHDMEGIYKFLRVPNKERNPTKFSPPEKFTHIHLAKLFERYGKTYIKGHKCANFISNINIDDIYKKCRELRDGLELIKRQKAFSKKGLLLTQILPDLKQQSAYFSLPVVKRALTAIEIELADDTLREYMSEAMATGVVSNAGRGWYSRHEQPVSLDPKPVAKIIREVKKSFPLLDFSCWSTVQFNLFAQHLVAQPTILLYAESDTLDTVTDALKSAGWDAWANPGKADVERFVRPGEKTVVLRPSIAKQPECKDHVAPIEKALVDLVIEGSKLQLMDTSEVQRILDNALGSGLMQLPVLFGYAETKREKIESKEITH